MAVTEFETGSIDEVYLVYTDFVNIARQIATTKKLLPLELEAGGQVMELQKGSADAAYEYEPDLRELLDEIIPRFTALQVYQAILEAQAREHAARHGGHAQRHGQRPRTRGGVRAPVQQDALANDHQ